MPSVAPPQTPAPISKGRTFVRRLGSTAALWAVVLTASFSTNRFVANQVFLVLMITLAAVGLLEFYALVEKRGLACFKGMGVAGGIGLMAGTYSYLTYYLPNLTSYASLPSKANDFENAVLDLFVLGLCVRQFMATHNKDGLTAIATTLFGLMYVPWLLNFIQKINFFPGIDGRYYVLYFIAVTKFSDVGAYCTGSLIGRHKMIPRISPGKTWEGFGGAILFSVLASLALASLFSAKLAGMNSVHAVILGATLSATAVLGDLIESLFKREAGVKDSGSIFPGIGGILDLLDSLLFNAPLMYLYLRHVLMHPHAP
jgi:phosphatidate cytidylyltransferase